ncbi:MAG: bifunctional glutamate N-acetyltransferase/amino-acid acetyltransferase ArgJ [Actinomycetota bacterium]
MTASAGLTAGEVGVCAAAGFRASGVAAGIKAGGNLDLALVISEQPASAAAVFTTNRVAAAPVEVSRVRLGAARGRARGVVVNSGCANAMTGSRGRDDAGRMADGAAAAAGIPPEEMLVCSTGLIGSYLPMDAIAQGIVEAARVLGRDDELAARAIMTTDSVPKRASVAHPDGWHVGGMAKGAGMIAPNMATMLAVITTDAAVERDLLATGLRRAADDSFNRITIDGDTSTNDSVIVIANGASGVTPEPVGFVAALAAVCRRLAQAIVADGEGATKLVRIRVEGAAGDAEAAQAARTVADSLLVKTALYGADANWGRVAAALGRSGVPLEADRLSIWMGGVQLVDRGAPSHHADVVRARAALEGREVEVRCDLGRGAGKAEILTTDLSPGYVRLNAAYEEDLSGR